jgi:hypothetical protein
MSAQPFRVREPGERRNGCPGGCSKCGRQGSYQWRALLARAVASHRRYVAFQVAEVAIPRHLFAPA